MSPHERRLIRRLFALGGASLGRGEHARFCVEVDGKIVRIVDGARLPCIEIQPYGVLARRDLFPNGFDPDYVGDAMDAAERFIKGKR